MTTNWVIVLVTVCLLLGFASVVAVTQTVRLATATHTADLAAAEAQRLVDGMTARAFERETTLTASVAKAEAEIAVLQAKVNTQLAEVRRPWRPSVRSGSSQQAALALTRAVTSTAVVALTQARQFSAREQLVNGQRLVTITSTEADLITDIVERLPTAVSAAELGQRMAGHNQRVGQAFASAYLACAKDNDEMAQKVKELTYDVNSKPAPLPSPGFFDTNISLGGIGVGVLIATVAGTIIIGAGQ